MKRIVLVLCFSFVLVSACQAKEIKVTVPEVKVSKVIDAFKGLYPIPQIPDSTWVDPQDGTMTPMIPKFTDDEWPRECVRMWIVAQVARYEQLKAQQSIKFQPDDTLAQ